MRRHVIDGGWYVDALPTGEWAASRHADAVLETHLGPMTPPERLLFVRVAVVHGVFKVAGQGHTSNKAVEWSRTRGWQTLPYVACGVSPVIYDAAGSLRVSDCGPGIGSQGFRYAGPAGVVNGDQTYTPAHGVDLFEWTDLGHGYRVGQGPDDNGAWLYDGTSYYEVITGRARFIRARLDGDLVSIACWVEPHRAEILWATVDEIRANFTAKASTRLPKPAPVPDSEIPNVPPVETPTMPDSLLADLEAERAKYPARLVGSVDAAAILNAVAWKHRGDGWGLSAKPSGNHVWSIGHQEWVAYDILHHKPTDTLWDVATGEWENFIPQWSQAEHHHNPERPWLAPVKPLSDVPAPTPTIPVPEVPMLIAQRDIIAAVTEAKAEVEALGYRFKTVEEASRDNYAHYTYADKQQAFLVTMRAAWKLAQRYPNAGIGLERYEGVSGTPSPFPEDGPARYSGDIILLGKSGPSCDVLIAGVQPAAQIDQTTDPQATSNWARDWAPPINPYRGVTVPVPPRVEPAPVVCKCDEVLAELQALRDEFNTYRLQMADMEVAIRNEIRDRPVYEGDINLGFLGTKRLRLEPK